MEQPAGEIPVITLRADVPEHFRLLVAAVQRLVQEFGGNHPLTKLANSYLREFEVYQDRKKVQPKRASGGGARGEPGLFTVLPRF
jgi:hypothetical protein